MHLEDCRRVFITMPVGFDPNAWRIEEAGVSRTHGAGSSALFVHASVSFRTIKRRAS